MTLCIAALCESDRGPAVVSSADLQVETQDASAEIGFKYVELTTRWTAMIAGTIAQARELCMSYRTMLLNDENAITEENADEMLYEPLASLRAKFVDRHVRRRLSLPYAEFLHYRERALTDPLYNEVAWEAARIHIEACLILIGWVGDEFLLYKVDGYDLTILRELEFTAIWTGASIASANLYQRKQEAAHTLTATLYNVYESHKLASIAPGVGPSNIIRTTEYTPQGTRALTYLLANELPLYEAHYKKYGPQDASDALPPPTFTRRANRSWDRAQKLGEGNNAEAQSKA